MAPPLAAQTLPHVYDITGVAADDVLNIRASPDAGAPIVGTLPHNAIGIEVLELAMTGSWAMVSTAEGNGWVAMRFMQSQPAPVGLPLPMSCGGTEPFWNLTITDAAATFSQLGLDSEQVSIIRTGETPNEYFAALGNGQIANIRREFCSDGMSDRIFGLKLSMFGLAGDAYTGCCTLQTGN